MSKSEVERARIVPVVRWEVQSYNNSKNEEYRGWVPLHTESSIYNCLDWIEKNCDPSTHVSVGDGQSALPVNALGVENRLALAGFENYTYTPPPKFPGKDATQKEIDDYLFHYEPGAEFANND